MNILAAFKGDYIAAVEFDGKTPTLTIEHVRVLDLEDDKGKTKARPVVYFRETKRGWVLNKTSAQALSALFTTPETDQWTGKRVTLAAEMVQFGKERLLGIRVKGSPDIAAPVTFELKLPRKRPQKITLVPTGKAAPKPPPPEIEAAAEILGGEIVDAETGEVF
jgi:hypothetical protein